MSEITKKILTLIDMGMTVNEISEITKLSPKQIYNLLNMIGSKGFEFNRKYYYSGDIVYVPKKSFVESKGKGVDIITATSDANFEALLISDLHIGSVLERIDLLNKIYDYCAKEGIHIIICGGDIIDGMYGKYPKLHDNIGDQIDYMLKNYPFDKSILNFTVLGDHDYDAMKKYGQNLSRVLESYRHDIVPLGYCEGQINIKNDKIFVRHPSDNFDEVNMTEIHRVLTLDGHSHKMKMKTSSDVTTINIPTLSGMVCDTEAQIPSAIKMNLEFNNGVIWHGTFSQLIINQKVERINEFECPLGYGKNISGNIPIRLEENRVKKRTLTLPSKGEQLSPMEKFIARYGDK